MEIKNTKIESFIKSFTFSLFLCLFWGYFTFGHIKSLLATFDFIELLWLVYNVLISLLFLLRERPVAVSMNLFHWVIALLTSFSGFFFIRESVVSNSMIILASEVLLSSSILLGLSSAVILGRSYDFLPALRQVKTEFVFKMVRHPMYLSSIIIKLGYVLKHPSIYNVLLFAFIAILYDKRAKHEEKVMSHSDLYKDYLQEVRYRFVPGIY